MNQAKYIYNSEAKDSRAETLTQPGAVLNGLKLVFVSLDSSLDPAFAWLNVEFYNSNGLDAINSDIQAAVQPAHQIFQISGGTRIKAGNGNGLVKVIEVNYPGGKQMRLKVAPVGDYSTYNLRAVYGVASNQKFDPVFAELDFKFRPGCFNVNCAPTGDKGKPTPIEPSIDYLAKDFASFKHVMLNAMRARVPQWQPTSEADFDQVLIDLISADADELSDFQDRVMNEAYFGRARKRVSLARHARLMDYHIHQGNQATTWLALMVDAESILTSDFCVWTGENWQTSDSVIFKASQSKSCLPELNRWKFYPELNRLELYDWRGLVTALEAGTTQADIALPADMDAVNNSSDADRLRDWLRSDSSDSSKYRYLLIEEKLNPETGNERGSDPRARQLVQLLEGNFAAESLYDPSAERWYVRVYWRREDALRRRYCFTAYCDGVVVTGVSAFHGNLLQVSHGRPHRITFQARGTPLAGINASAILKTDAAYFENTRWGMLCTLPYAPLAYLNTEPGGEKPVFTTLTVRVDGVQWCEQNDLIESEASHQHFIVETDEFGISRVRFGRAPNGLAPPVDATIECTYQVGRGGSGNIGADTLTGFDPLTATGVTACWNPFDVIDGRDPELPSEIIRRAPEAYRQRQLRAVTLSDYAKRAEELPGVAHAQACYGWTGSWRTVRVAIDPQGTTDLSEQLRKTIEAHLDAVRLIGEDLEVRPAQYVALDIKLKLCAKNEYWPEDLLAELAREFSDGYTSDGRFGFFHPDLWTFGQTLYASQLIGRAMAVIGIERVLFVSIRRWNTGFGSSTSEITIDPADLPDMALDEYTITPFEIIRVANDPSHLEYGRIQFDIRGGRR